MEHQRVLFKAVTEFAAIAIRGIVLINGGAAIAILAFLGQALGRDKPLPDGVVAAGMESLMWFVAGAGAGVLTAAFAYLAQAIFAEVGAETGNKTGGSFRILAIVSATTGLGLFAYGAWSAREAFIG